ncbi:unnamed protein product [Linum trigynum]|uniref:Uncharacterized protein n=1 Tax=Linum trigynum TaxID=586398 RepID=A0AAV2GWR2_9ROSI
MWWNIGPASRAGLDESDFWLARSKLGVGPGRSAKAELTWFLESADKASGWFHRAARLPAPGSGGITGR